jgi:uncharacterized surface protein with fasciclin (FAS1) repeats
MRFLKPLVIGILTTTALAACDNQGGSAPKSEEAREAAGDNTLDQLLGDADSSFMTAAKAAGLDTTLAGPGPYTIFVPSNSAFEKLPAGAMDNMLKPESRAQLTKLLSNHILSGSILAEDIGKAIDNGKGQTQLMTIGGGTLTATKDGDKIVLTDEAGGKSVVTGADGKASNGVIHRVDGVLMPA